MKKRRLLTYAKSAFCFLTYTNPSICISLITHKKNCISFLIHSFAYTTIQNLIHDSFFIWIYVIFINIFFADVIVINHLNPLFLPEN